eukprot:5801497-Ditylum_brightwellii.AAC.1
MVHVCNRVRTDGTVFFHGVDNGDDGADKHLTHLSQVADCCLTERSERNEHVVCNKDDDVDDGVDDGVDNGEDDTVEDYDDDGVENGDDGADKHLTHLSQAADYHLTWRSERNEHVVCNKDDGVDDGVDDSNDGADKHPTHLIHVKNNGNLGVCEKNLTHAVKNTLTSLISDVTGH